MGNDGLGKKAEAKVKQWLDRPELGYCFDRLADQMTGFYGSKNICDFLLYKYPYKYYLESKATWGDRWAFDSLSEYQRTKMLEKSEIEGVRSIVIVLYATHKRAFMFHVSDIQNALDNGTKSLNITKQSKWSVPYVEIDTVFSSRKELLDYTGDFQEKIESAIH